MERRNLRRGSIERLLVHPGNYYLGQFRGWLKCLLLDLQPSIALLPVIGPSTAPTIRLLRYVRKPEDCLVFVDVADRRRPVADELFQILCKP